MPQVGDTLDVNSLIVPDNKGRAISETWLLWDNLRAPKKAIWKEIQANIAATDTSNTMAGQLPWKNTTTIPKLTQVRDNLIANYMAIAVPNDRWLTWEGADEESETKEKVDAITGYMGVCIEQPQFKSEMNRAAHDFVDYGNVFGMPVWVDERVMDDKTGRQQFGFVGPSMLRISPWDIVFNPIARSFNHTPKIIRSVVTLGDLKNELFKSSHEEGEKEAAQGLWDYLQSYRNVVAQFAGDLSGLDSVFQIEGFGSFQEYLKSDYAEVLSFYGDFYDRWNDKLYKNYLIKVVDRHKVFYDKPLPTYLGYPPIFHVGWRTLQDTLWAMGPLENLLGMQYRLDHIENLKADLFDLVTFPPIHIKGYVADFKWGPMEQIVTDKDGEVELLTPNVNPLSANFELKELEDKMEEMAGSPKQTLGIKPPGEMTKYQSQSLDNASSRVFQQKIKSFEVLFAEPCMNAMLDMARRLMNETTIRILNDDLKVASFSTLSPEDIAGAGRIKPIAARHFVEKAALIQDMSNFYASGIGQDPAIRMHLSSVRLAKVFEDLLEISRYKIFMPYIRVTEQAEAQRMAMQQHEETIMQQQTPSGMTPDDASQPFSPQGGPPQGGPQMPMAAPPIPQGGK